ncbi:tyrosine-type recombinase/integrase [Methylobacterium radiotolerans]|uniref:Integrase family protein n=1 Tax=Methylobacterium radiotolerans (strain ATCC 27329 / DSM 1819 / JCM 2831 / NBRC 15690 / NCIMB 10815 / 0-1) TaxID=426355 RepID=B1M2P6_METRJ|nr:site-specific integrase [Methylobacterium radiotolerans]ACB27694.1 integrase family protein [Methylobacterium radiotolerans JCM 2831]GEM95863.1 integrase [Methylobacterium radiotolerans]
MAREINRLSARKVQTMNEPGRHADGGGLYLVVEASGSKRWVMLYRMPGRRREMGLGSVGSVSLARARELAAAARAQIADGIDPIEAKAAAAEPRAPAAPVAFSDVALTYMADRESTWRNASHRAQWRQTLEVQAASLWSMPVADIGTDDVLAVLRPMWHEKAETARRIRGRIERVLDAARVGGHRSGENPARWRGHLDVLLPQSRKLTRGHHKAMPYAEVPAFYAAIAAGRTSFSSLALRFTILTAARSGETRGLTWGEVDMGAALWTVPAPRMKAGRQHRVPLSSAAIAILASVRPGGARAEDLVFPSRAGSRLSDMALAMFLRGANPSGFTVHGFRSSFRDWVTEETDFPGELAEAALAHLVGDETERAYRRGDALEKRRHLMDAWAAFVAADKAAPSSTRASSE